MSKTLFIIALIDQVFDTRQDHDGTVSAESPDFVDHILRQTLQETHDQEATAFSDAPDGRRPPFPPNQDGSQMAVQDKEEHAGGTQGQRCLISCSLESSREPVILQQCRQDRQRCRLGGRQTQVQRPLRREDRRKAGRREQAVGRESVGSFGGFIEYCR